jgi:protocatechuate 3,4-dioxygenase beta subunit
MKNPGVTRRRVVTTGLSVPALLLVPAVPASVLAATPACDDEPTPRQTAGPFFKPDSPGRATLAEPGGGGEPLILQGRVLSTACRPLPGAVVDVWHAGPDGDYDLAGFRWRGHQAAGADGGWRFVTVVPGSYGSRTRHVHLRVQVAGGPLLATQLYFPGDEGNGRDFLFRPDLLMDVVNGSGGRHGRFDVVLAA